MAGIRELPDQLLEHFGLSDASFSPLPGDASSRCYARVAHPKFGPVLLLADTPHTPHFENFLLIGSHLAGLGFSTPRILQVDHDAGAALIEDFGDATYTRLLDAGTNETHLYERAIDTLTALHTAPGATDIDLPAYDMERLLEEVNRFTLWFAPVVNPDIPECFTRRHTDLWREALKEQASRQSALVLRDYHVDNLISLDSRRGIARCGLLDFQDGLLGSPAYDVVSLTQDARRDLSTGLEEHCVERYLAACNPSDHDRFLRDYWRLGAQRHAKVAGLFHRLSRRDAKHGYLVHVPRVLRLLDRALKAAGLDEIKSLYDTELRGWADWTP